MIRRVVWPRGLLGRLTLLVLAAVLLQFVGASVLQELAERTKSGNVHADHLAERLAIGERALSSVPPGQRPQLAAALSTADLALSWSPHSAGAEGGVASPWLRDLEARLQKRDSGLAGRGLTLDRGVGEGEPHRVRGELRLADGSVLGFDVTRLQHGLPDILRSLLSTALLASCLLIAAPLLVRALGAPLRQLVRAADAIGRGRPVPVAVEGPMEVRRLARALNAMQDRLARLIADQTQALAAVSHDLRTPIGRLRLRTDLMEDRPLQAEMQADLDEMEQMVGSVLAYLKGDTDPEPPRAVDLVALLTTLVDDAADAGQDAAYRGPDRAVLQARPLALKRAFANLIDNAVTYGGSARVVLRCSETEITVAIADDGPGIPEPDLIRVLEPFQRIEGSRSRATGGVGLGLAIALQAVEREGGRLSLVNRPGGGLTAEVTLPRR
ncbi:ATP-binding protein [Inquilinus sp. Marseille-Q2685]|uniref:ATP-binding protein n=1 Tax=Inquilinus sp. Marseille-Q2685 TaxID=2866581 RepID=UPI001CE4755E|nr:ATP-binding protein [Inquilinus sp. Marseille-Q2685]